MVKFYFNRGNIKNYIYKDDEEVSGSLQKITDKPHLAYYKEGKVLYAIQDARIKF